MSEIIDGNVLGPANLARRDNLLPARNDRSDRKQKHAGSTYTRRRRSASKSDEPFTVRVKRRFNSAKAKLGMKLGLYSQEHFFPLGLYVDVFA